MRAELVFEEVSDSFDEIRERFSVFGGLSWIIDEVIECFCEFVLVLTVKWGYLPRKKASRLLDAASAKSSTHNFGSLHRTVQRRADYSLNILSGEEFCGFVSLHNALIVETGV
jgi:hypothetical protein